MFLLVTDVDCELNPFIVQIPGKLLCTTATVEANGDPNDKLNNQ